MENGSSYSGKIVIKQISDADIQERNEQRDLGKFNVLLLEDYSEVEKSESLKIKNILSNSSNFNPHLFNLNPFNKLEYNSDEYQQKLKILLNFLETQNIHFIIGINKLSKLSQIINLTHNKNEISYAVPYILFTNDEEKEVIL